MKTRLIYIAIALIILIFQFNLYPVQIEVPEEEIIRAFLKILDVKGGVVKMSFHIPPSQNIELNLK